MSQPTYELIFNYMVKWYAKKFLSLVVDDFWLVEIMMMMIMMNILIGKFNVVMNMNMILEYLLSCCIFRILEEWKMDEPKISLNLEKEIETILETDSKTINLLKRLPKNITNNFTLIIDCQKAKPDPITVPCYYDGYTIGVGD